MDALTGTRNGMEKGRTDSAVEIEAKVNETQTHVPRMDKQMEEFSGCEALMHENKCSLTQGPAAFELKADRELFIDRLKNELEHANALIDNLRDEKNKLMERVNSLEKERGISHSTSFFENLFHKFAKHDSEELNHIREDLAEENSTVEKLTAKLARLQHEAAACRKERDTFSNANKALVEHIAQFEKPTGEFYNVENQKLKHELQELRTQLMISSAANEELQVMNDKLQTQLNNLQTQSALPNEVNSSNEECGSTKEQLKAEYCRGTTSLLQKIAAQRSLAEFEI
jgi:chromosome segregation ATPase